MKLLRYGERGKECPGVLDHAGNIRDLSSVVDDIDGATLSDEQLDRIRQVELSELPIVNDRVRMGPCVKGVGKFLCVGLNYTDHAEEAGMSIPDEPVIFSKFTSAICGADDDILIPRNSVKTDWEVELGVVIGKSAQYLNEQEAEECIAGYCLINDLSEREFQLEKSGQWDLGKGCDTFGPIGPWLVTRDEIPDLDDLGLWLRVNGEQVQTGNTRMMVFKPASIVSYLSQYMSLKAGDIISTGTPAGVGLGFTPPRYLKAGDTVELGIDGLGEQRHLCRMA